MSTEIHAKRCRWRAALCRIGAETLRADVASVSESTAALLTARADAAEAEAELHELEASITQRLADIKARRAAGAFGPRTTKEECAAERKAYDAAAGPVAAERTYWRQIGEACGTRRLATSVDNFSEPSDSDLAEMDI